MKCIVTGASGFIGSHLTDLLIGKGHEVIGVDDLSTGREANLELSSKNPRFKLLKKSILDLEASDIDNSIDWIFHLAGRADLVPSIINPEEYFKVNVEGTFKLLQLARTINCKRFIYCASSTCYGIPDVYPTPEDYPCKVRHPYGLTKMLGEELVLHWSDVYKVPAVSLRLFNVYGPRSRTSGVYGAVFGVFLKQKLENQPYTVVGDGNQTRDFTYVTDVTRAFLAAANTEVIGEIFNVGSGNTYSINKLIHLLKGSVVYLPKRPGEPEVTFADITKIKNHLFWNPEVSFEEGVSKVVEHIDHWREAPLWDKDSIGEATKDWFRYLNKQETINSR